jgi:hypothetical protein
VGASGSLAMSLYSSKLVTSGAATTTTADFFKKLRRLKRMFMAHMLQ